MKQVKYNNENPNGVLVDYTAEETSNNETAKLDLEQRKQQEQDAKTANENLKASAKAKLIAGEALTEEEANVMIGG